MTMARYVSRLTRISSLDRCSLGIGSSNGTIGIDAVLIVAELLGIIYLNDLEWR